MSRRSYTYEKRLIKYAQRGFLIAIPGLPVREETKRKNRISEIHFDQERISKLQPDQCRGLTKLLIAYCNKQLEPFMHSNRQYIQKSKIIRETETEGQYYKTDYGWSSFWDTHMTGNH